MQVWVVYEANVIVPRVFKRLKDAEKYREDRMARIFNRHNVYIAPTDFDEGDETNEPQA